MKIHVLWSIILAETSITVQAASPIVSNVRVSQRAGTKLVDILYDVADADSVPLLPLKADETIVSWGENYGRQDTVVPANLSNVVSVSDGGLRSMALKSDGSVIAWGLNTAGESTVPSDLKDFVAIGPGGNHCVALKDYGIGVTWGENRKGESSVPAGHNIVIAICAGSNHSLAIRRP